jgi:hypothetical protein
VPGAERLDGAAHRHHLGVLGAVGLLKSHA